jgi:hypothetical protein
MKLELELVLFQWKSKIDRVASMRRSTTEAPQARLGNGRARNAVILRPARRTPARPEDMELSKYLQDRRWRVLSHLQHLQRMNVDLKITLEKLWL